MKSGTLNGLISCIIPVYNRERLITESVSSVLDQTYQNYEIIIVDDGSTDQTPEVIKNLAAEHPNKIKILKQSNQGPGAARQFGLDHAQGEYIQFLDSDDLILPNKFELFVEAFESENKPDIVYATTHYYEIGNPENYMIWKLTNQKLDSVLPDFFISRAWGTATPIYRHLLLNQVDEIVPLSCEEDLEYECRIGLHNPKLHFIDQHLTDIRHHPGNRFSVDNPNRTEQLSHQIQAREHIYQTMLEFGLDQKSQPMRDFAKYLFLLARQASELGMTDESILAFDLAQKAGGKLPVKDKLAMNIFKATNSIFGPKLFNKIYNRLHKLKN